MALTRKLLKGLNLTDEQVDAIIDAHTETVEGLKAEVSKYKTDAEKLPAIQDELDELKSKGDDGWKERHDTVKKELDDYKKSVEAEKTNTAKEAAVRAFYEAENITGKNLEIAMRGSKAEIEAIELADGKIKDDSALKELVKGDFAALVSTVKKKGVDTPTPPNKTGNDNVMTEAEIYKMENGRYVLSASQRQEELAKLMQKGD